MYSSSENTVFEILKNSSIFSAILNKISQLSQFSVHFQEQIPKELYNLCRIEQFSDNILTLSTDSPVSAHRLRFEKNTLLTKLKAIPKFQQITDIKLKIRPSHEAPPPPSKMGMPSSLSRQNQEILYHIALNSPDRLQKALLKLCHQTIDPIQNTQHSEKKPQKILKKPAQKILAQFMSKGPKSVQHSHPYRSQLKLSTHNAEQLKTVCEYIQLPALKEALNRLYQHRDQSETAISGVMSSKQIFSKAEL